MCSTLVCLCRALRVAVWTWTGQPSRRCPTRTSSCSTRAACRGWAPAFWRAPASSTSPPTRSTGSSVTWRSARGRRRAATSTCRWSRRRSTARTSSRTASGRWCRRRACASSTRTRAASTPSRRSSTSSCCSAGPCSTSSTCSTRACWCSSSVTWCSACRRRAARRWAWRSTCCSRWPSSCSSSWTTSRPRRRGSPCSVSRAHVRQASAQCCHSLTWAQIYCNRRGKGWWAKEHRQA